ncbi:hypothetical protein ALC60_09247 [Trachymyrmex zeteki]|uniref:Uncharacterized protein n=1 Tax=Mycetomoellerius zeteki TaxID=64791 RepID=A0A151WUQ9_9HYME|nr:PREDICTED: uncharacterized protein LOC108726033 [Trachymyrmex zeteki]KYQ51659.1 hypothetical protein ALC60_09247 [Trachymyrmex zeteki]
MTAVFKLQLFLIVIICFYLKSSYGFKLPYNGVKIVTYGEPCQSPRYLPVSIEEPAKPVTEIVSPKWSCEHQPLKLNYRVISTEPIPYQSRKEYPISVEVPQMPQPLEIITPDSLQGKSYAYNIQVLPPPSVPISRRHDFDVQVPPSPSPISVPTPQSVNLLTGLTSKIDRILIPACQVTSSGCCNTA